MKTLFILFGFFITKFSKILGLGLSLITANTVNSQNPSFLEGGLDVNNVSFCVHYLYNPSKTIVEIKDSTFTRIKSKNLIIDSLGSGRNDGTPTSVVWADNTGTLKRSPIYTPTTFTASRAINSATFQVSSTKPATVFYTIRISCTASIGSAAAGTLALQYSTNNGSTWIDVGQLENSNTVTLAITLNSVTSQCAQICGIVPAGAILRMNQTISGTTTITFVRGQETY